MKQILLILLVLFVISFPVLFVFANGLPNPLGSGDVLAILNRIMNALVFEIAPPIVAIMVLVGAFQILFAGGNEEKFKIGKKTITYTVIGYAILLLSLGIVSIINEILSSA